MKLLRFILTLCLWAVYMLSSGGDINIIIPPKETELNDVKNTAIDDVVKQAFAMQKENKNSEALNVINSAINQAEGQHKGKLKNKLGYLKYYMKDIEGAEKEWKDVAFQNVPSSEKDICDSKLRLAYIKYRNGKYETALEDFKDIATGAVKADYYTAKDASLRVAFLYRKSKDLKQSLSVFRQIMTKVTDINDVAYAKIQVAGTLWELGKGDEGILTTDEEKTQAFLESRQLCKELMDQKDITDLTCVEGSYIRAIAELINIETFWFLKDYEQTICLAENFIPKWSQVLSNFQEYNFKNSERPIRRQILTAQTWLLMAYYRVGRYQDCIEMCKKVNSPFWNEGDPYKNFNVFGYAYLYEAKSNETLGRKDVGQQIRKIIETKYPKWYNLTAAYEELKYLE